jgi:hypothetical protein
MSSARGYSLGRVSCLRFFKNGAGAAKPRHQNPANRGKTLKKAGFNHYPTLAVKRQKPGRG